MYYDVVYLNNTLTKHQQQQKSPKIIDIYFMSVVILSFFSFTIVIFILF